MLKKILFTVRFLKLKQLRYQIFYRLRKPKGLRHYKSPLAGDVTPLCFLSRVQADRAYYGDNKFSFLNLTKTFKNKIEWGYKEYGALWNYNLQYSNWLHQNDINDQEKLKLIRSLYRALEVREIILEPYPVSLRAINVIRFCSSRTIYKSDILANLHAELNFLSHRYEYHILGNHLLENAFALSMGGAFFKNSVWRDNALKILLNELEEQILNDGAHFELSPMYHNIVFFRLLEFIDWYGEYHENDAEILAFCKSKASLMLDWLHNIRFNNGEIPLFNDSAKGIGLEPNLLISYARDLGIERNFIPLKESGYRSFAGKNYEIKVDLAQIGASYQPGHAHADALSFILYYNDNPVFVEQGTSTYQLGERRDLERSTEAHNTVVVNAINQSEVWGGFRVGRRAKTRIQVETKNGFVATHDGYKRFGIVHTRKFLVKRREVKVTDELSKPGDAKFYLHIHPDRIITRIDDRRFSIDNDIVVSLTGATSIDIEDYNYAEMYNKYQPAKRLAVSFAVTLTSTFLFQDSR